uniref:MYND-type domain-containing protein n=1 Tax=Arcella intermedia TaxID=1963864 RepID=A0A6B2L747_9EUKA
MGFAEEVNYDDWYISSSKIGGRPVWLEPLNIPTASDVACGRCGVPMSFLLQIYAPLSGDQTYHRVLYVFCCKKLSCIKNCSLGSFKVFRSQLTKQNTYYTQSTQDPDNFLPTFKSPNLCAVSGLAGTLKCSGCKSVYYASKQHQILHWNHGAHKKFCKLSAAVDPSKEGAPEKLAELLNQNRLEDQGVHYSCNFLEFEIVTEPASSTTQSNPSEFAETIDYGSEDENSEDEKTKEDNMQMIQKYDKSTKRYDNAEFDDNDWVVNENQKDIYFLNFTRHTKREPDQVLRYYEDSTTTPLWISAKNKLPNDSVPKCDCGAERICEFQVMPQLLDYLDVEKDEEPIDWGTLVIYTCKNNCKNHTYSQEFLWVQQIEK